MEEVAVTVLILQSKIRHATTHMSVQPMVRECFNFLCWSLEVVIGGEKKPQSILLERSLNNVEFIKRYSR